MKATSCVKLKRFRNLLALFLLDAISIAASFFAALWLRFEFDFSKIRTDFFETYFQTIFVWIVISIIVFAIFRLYSTILSFAGMEDLFRISEAYIVLSIIGVALTILLDINMPRSYYIIGIIFSFASTTFIRFTRRITNSISITIAKKHLSNVEKERIMIIGAGYAGRMLIHEYAESDKLLGKVVCLIDDNSYKKGYLLEGVPVVGGREDIPHFVKQYSIDKILFAIPSCSGKDRKEILDICSKTGCKVEILPGIYQLVTGQITAGKLRTVQIQDLLGRDQIRVNMDEIYNYISGKVVMVTGGGGSIGSELCRQIALSNPKTLIIFDIYENNAYDIQLELQKKYPELNLVTLIGSVRNTARLEDVLSKYKPNIVFHAAAHKHVPLMEDSPNEAIKNNVFGTYKMSKAAAKHGVEKFVLISTDKAVNPTNIMGASKRLCEMVVQMMNRVSKHTDFVAVRFGNVLGSNGSVIPLFEKQIAAGGPVTVTHPDITRFFMTIPEAVSLVLQAGYYANGGEIYVLDMGQPVKIADMAKNLIRLSGYEPGVDIQIEYTGLRPGEKLYEELLMNEEGLQDTENKLIHIGKPIVMDDELFLTQLDRLKAACESESETIKDIVAEIVPTYKRQD